jgi:arsenate reductase (thioredoxin)
VSASEQVEYSLADRPSERADLICPIIFVGGTGRSGTHVVARFLGRHRAITSIGVECRFHVDDDGFPGLIDGSTDLDAFLKKLRGFWWKGKMRGRDRGMYKFLDEERLEWAIARFESSYDQAEPEPACRQLFIDLLWPQVVKKGSSALVEQSCDTVAQAPLLLRLFPEAKFVHVVRDGRDASASRVSQTRGLVRPRTRHDGLRWFERRIRRIEDGARQIPGEKLFQVSLEEILTPPRHEAARAVVGFIGVRFGRRMRRYFYAKMDLWSANTERWREGISERKQRAIDERYEAMLDRLEADNVSSAPILRNVYERRIDAPPVLEAPPPKVLFVCVQNAGRSKMAATLLKEVADGRVRARSAGSKPADHVHPVVVEVMAEKGIDISQKTPRPIKDKWVEEADVVVTMGCGDACPYFPGKRYIEWELDDPAGEDIETVRRIRDEIEGKVRALVEELAPQSGEDSDADAAAASRPSDVVTS